MSDITVTAARVAVVQPTNAEVYDFRTTGTFTPGDIVYDNAGNLAASDASAAGTTKAVGMVLRQQGGAVSVLKRGLVYGFDLSGLAIGALVYLSNTAETLADAAGDNSLVLGRVVALTDTAQTKVLWFEANWLA